MKEFGAALKKAREESGLSLEQIHDRTRINLKHLRAIESGDFPSVPQTYVRAFIREYASLIGLDAEAILAEYNELAEQTKGIPKPPEAIDHSHLMPTNDDSVEIVETSSPGAIPKHVEVEGKMEVEEQEFTLPVKRSRYVSDDHKSVDLPSTRPRHEEPEPETPAKDPNQLELPVDEPETETAEEPKEAAPAVKAPEPPKKEEPAAPPKQEGKKPDPPKQAQPEPTPPKTDEPKQEAPKATAAPPATPKPSAPPAKQPEKPKAATPPSQKQTTKKEKVQQVKQRLADRIKFGKKLSDKPAQKEQKQKPAKPPKKRTPEDEEQRRLLIVGSLITLAIIIGIYGIVYFSDDTSTGTIATADSTRTQTNIYAERFIDSTDFIPDEPEILPDTTTGAVTPPAGNQQQNENVYASEDSLILEAFSSTPVYFSIRMDTTKTEKGFLSKNEHRVWKAKDRFIISLGDAGAMTFFLNGKQLKSLGGEGLAINNHVINRKTLDQE